MEKEILRLASSQGIGAILAIGLIFYILKAQEKRDVMQEEREKNYQNIISNLISKVNNQCYEAAYNKYGELLTENNNYLNMGTYNYVGPNNVSGHIVCDVEPFYEYGNIENTGRSAFRENSIAAENILKFLGNQDAQNNYDTYAKQFRLSEVKADYQKNHEVW